MSEKKATLGTKVSDREKHIKYLFDAELQFRLASAVRLATNLETQPLDLPVVWTHGKHSVHYNEIALRDDQAKYAAVLLHRSAMYLMAVAIKDAIPAIYHDPKNSSDPVIKSAYQIARMIRNSFAHAPFAPAWDIDKDCENKVFSVPRIIRLDTHNLNGQPFDWRHYGGPLALLRLCRFVRIKILGDKAKRRRRVPQSKIEIHQIGDLILRKAEIPEGARRVEVQPLPDGLIPIPGAEGHFLGALRNTHKSKVGPQPKQHHRRVAHP